MRRVRNSQFLANVIRVGGGGAIGQALIVAASPILTRLFDPAEFGVYAIYTSLVIIVGSVACLRFDVPIPVPRRDTTATSLGRLSSISLVSVAGIAGLGTITFLWFGQDNISIDLAPWWGGLLVFVGIVGYGGYQLLNYWAIRRRLYKELGQTRITRGGMQVAIQVGAGALGAGAGGLIVGHALGHLFGFFAIGRDFLSLLRRTKASCARLRWTARRYRSYAMFSAPAALLSSVTMQLPAVLLALFYGPVVAGIYAVAQRVIATPASIVGTAISQVFMGETMKLARTSASKMRRAYTRALILSAIVGVLPIGLIAAGGPWLFGLVLGSEWVEAGRFVRVMSAMFAVQFAVYPVSQTLHAIERPDLQLFFDAMRMFLGIGTLLILGWSGVPALGTLLGYSLGMVIAYCLYIGLGYRALSLHSRRLPRE